MTLVPVPAALPGDDSGGEPQVLARMPPPDPNALARIDAWLAAMTPDERALIEEAGRLDRVDYERNR